MHKWELQEHIFNGARKTKTWGHLHFPAPLVLPGIPTTWPAHWDFQHGP